MLYKLCIIDAAASINIIQITEQVTGDRGFCTYFLTLYQTVPHTKKMAKIINDKLLENL